VDDLLIAQRKGRLRGLNLGDDDAIANAIIAQGNDLVHSHGFGVRLALQTGVRRAAAHTSQCEKYDGGNEKKAFHSPTPFSNFLGYVFRNVICLLRLN